MKFADLDERAKNRARGRWRECELEDDWWDGVYEDAVTIGALMGCEVGENVTRTVGGHPAKQYDISFSGFCSQGDGACWSGFLDTAKLAGAVERMRAMSVARTKPCWGWPRRPKNCMPCWRRCRWRTG